VNRRVNTQFYLETGNGYANPAPGTIIDTDVTGQNPSVDPYCSFSLLFITLARTFF
jgi:hypothetical protein